MRRVSLLNLALLAFGCTTVGPDFEQPSAPVSGDWEQAGASGVNTDSFELVEWWQVFEDPVLNNLIQHAYQENNDLQISGLRVLEARARLGIAVGTQFPQVQQAVGGATYVARSKSGANTAGGDLRYWEYDVGATVSWELDFWGRFRRGIESADASLLASIANYDNVLVLLTAQVADTYIRIRTTQEQLRVAKDNAAIQQRSVDITEVRFRNGHVDELDVQQARSQFLGTLATIPELERQLVQFENALSVLLGRPPRDLSDLLGGGTSIPALPLEISVGVPADLLRRRPDVRQAELQAAAQSARIGIAEADLYPSIFLSGSLGLVAGDATNSTRTGESGIGELLSTDSINFVGGPSFTWNFLNYGRIKNNVRVQDARLQQLLVNYQQTVLNAMREVEDAFVSYGRKQIEGHILGEAVNAAQRSVELANVRYREGLSGFQRVLDAQGSLFRQQQRHVTNRGETANSVVAMYRALGGGWQYREGQEFVDAANKDAMRERVEWGDLLGPGAVEPSGLGEPEEK